MSSRPHTGVKWRWVAAIAVGLLSMYFFVWSGNGSGQPGSDAITQPASASAQPLATGPETDTATPNPGPRTTDELPPPARLGAAPVKTPPPDGVVDTIRVGETYNTARNNPGASRKPASPPRPDPGSLRPPGSPGSPNSPGSTSARAGSQLTRGMNMIREGRLVQGRRELSQLLFADAADLSPLDAQSIRDTLASVNKQLIFSSEITPGDPLAESYLVQRGDYLSRIAPRYAIPYQFIERINRIKAERLQAGKNIKVIKGPFHARISKSDFRMDIYINDPDGRPLFVRSFPVGLGKSDSTPQGAFVVQANSKVQNPSWRNPRTGEFFGKDDPKNPVGEYWLALKGTEPATESVTGYGLHGTIDPSSIGRQASMGCIRMRSKDIELVYDMLEGGQSTVQIGW
jgi:lipoprotein-anchoring transpeptidase ErfK/SrfK